MCEKLHSIVAVLGSFFLHFITMGMVQSFGIIFIEILENFQASKADTSWIPSLGTGLMFVIGPVTGILERKFGCRAVAITGSIFMTVGMASSMFVKSIYLLYITYGVVTGIGFGLVHLVGYTVINEKVQEKKSIAMGIGSAGSGVGTIVLPLLSTFCVQKYSWRWTFLILSGICSTGIIFGALFGSGRSRENTDNTGGKSSWKDIMDISKSIWSQMDYVLFLLSGVSTALVIFVPFVMTPDLAVLSGIKKDESAIVITAAGITSIIGRLFVGFVSESRCIDRTLLNGVILILGGCVTFACVHFQSLPAFIVYGAILGLFTGTFGAMQGIAMTYIVGVEKFGLAFGYLTFCQGIAITAGLPIAGWITDVSGGYTFTYYYTGVFFIIGGVCSCLVWGRRKIKHEKVIIDIFSISIAVNRNAV